MQSILDALNQTCEMSQPPEKYVRNYFSLEQLATVYEIMDGYLSLGYFCLLLAQMQSGKTGVFYFVAFEMLRNKVVEGVDILCGSSDIQLRNQHRLDNPEMQDIYDKYQMYLLELKDMSLNKVQDIIKDIKSRIRVLFGVEMTKATEEGPYENRLIIHDESHYAQSKNNRPSKFLEKRGVSANGSPGILHKNNIYYLSVSATPVSELSDLFHQRQRKFVVRMLPGAGYQSVQNYLEQGNIHGYDTWEHGFQNAIAKTRVNNNTGYGIVRISEKFKNDAQTYLRNTGYDIVHYDANHTRNKHINDILRTLPVRPTIIFIKGMLRMGERIVKDHILFCLESSHGSKTDTLMQSLLGRCCGYHTNDRIQFYFDNQFLTSGEIERFIAMSDDNDIIPYKAMNMKSTYIPKPKPVSHLFDIVPITLTVPVPLQKNDKQLCQLIRKQFMEALQSYPDNFVCHNSQAQRQAVLSILDASKTGGLRHLSSENKTYQKVPSKIREAIDERKPSSIGSSAGVSTKGDQVNLWYVDEDMPEYGWKQGQVILTCKTKVKPEGWEEKTRVVPRTTGQEIFN